MPGYVENLKQSSLEVIISHCFILCDYATAHWRPGPSTMEGRLPR